jgi:hypothetical protein
LEFSCCFEQNFSVMLVAKFIESYRQILCIFHKSFLREWSELCLINRPTLAACRPRLVVDVFTCLVVVVEYIGDDAVVTRLLRLELSALFYQPEAVSTYARVPAQMLVRFGISNSFTTLVATGLFGDRHG